MNRWSPGPNHFSCSFPIPQGNFNKYTSVDIYFLGAKETELSNLLNMVDLEEKRWLIRIILKNVKLGLSESKLLELFHERAVTILNSNNNLLKVD